MGSREKTARPEPSAPLHSQHSPLCFLVSGQWTHVWKNLEYW